MSVYKLLVEGRERIRRGWTRDIWHNADRTAYCALGALLSHGKSMTKDIPVAAAQALKAELPPTYAEVGLWTIVAAWNDAPGRTKEEVLALYDRAIAKLEPKKGAEIAKEIMAKPRIPEDVKSEEITTC